MESVHIVTSHSTHQVYVRCLCDCSKCDSSVLDLDFPNSSWSIDRLKEYLRGKQGTIDRHSRKSSILNAKYLGSQSKWSRRIHTACTPRRCSSTDCNLKKKKSFLAQTSPAMQPLPLAFCQLPMVSGLIIWPRRRHGQTSPLSLNASYVLHGTLTWETCGRKENTAGTAPVFVKCLAFFGFKELVMEESTGS